MVIIFETPRLFVRELRDEDLGRFHEMQSNPNVMRYAYGEPRSRSQNAIELQKCITAYSRPGNDFWVWAVVSKAESSFVGTCAVVPSGDGDNEIGYRFLENKWGNGFGHEICRGLIQYLIDVRELNSIVAHCSEQNLASVAILRQSRLLECFGEDASDDEGELTFRWKRSN